MISIGRHWKQYRTLLWCLVCAWFGFFSGGAQAGEGLDMNPFDPHQFAFSQNGGDSCKKTNLYMLKACKFEAQDDTQVASAKCLNLNDRQAAETCTREARAAFTAAIKECGEVREARDQVCVKVGPAAYDPVIDPANFVVGITNPYTPFPPGAFRVYEKRTAEGVERIRVEVLPETRVIQGVTVTTLRDTVTLNGVLIEDTKDWLAQDRQGNVWYLGEIVQNFENGLLANLDGSFESGQNGAKAGFWSKAMPQIGETYRQEWSLGNAEDIVEVVSLDARDTVVPFSQNGTGPVLKTQDTTPLSPGVIEYKYYVPGIGFALEVKPATGERLELVDYGPR